MVKIYYYLCMTILLHFLGHHAMAEFRLGVENLPNSFAKSLNMSVKKPIKFALIANHTSKDQRGKRTIDLLRACGIQISCLLAPEYGFAGAVAAGKTVADVHDAATNTPIYSLYAHGSGKSMDKSVLDVVDAFIFDLQDIGMRHFTYISTLLYAMRTAAEHDKPFVVLDRPNLLGGSMEGPVVSSDIAQKKSFIAVASIPLRHGMTLGELAQYFNTSVLTKPVRLHVVKMHDYTRQADFSEALLAYNLSPNIPTKRSCYGYSFLGLLGEVRPLDIGIGTSRPFSTIALSDKQVSLKEWRQLSNLLLQTGVPAVPCSYFSARKKKQCYGVCLEIAAIDKVRSFNALLTVLQFLKEAGVALTFSPRFDRAVGTVSVRHCIEGSLSRNQLVAMINSQLRNFFVLAQDSFIYSPLPRLALMI